MFFDDWNFFMVFFFDWIVVGEFFKIYILFEVIFDFVVIFLVWFRFFWLLLVIGIFDKFVNFLFCFDICFLVLEIEWFCKGDDLFCIGFCFVKFEWDDNLCLFLCIIVFELFFDKLVINFFVCGWEFEVEVFFFFMLFGILISEIWFKYRLEFRRILFFVLYFELRLFIWVVFVEIGM